MKRRNCFGKLDIRIIKDFVEGMPEINEIDYYYCRVYLEYNVKHPRVVFPLSGKNVDKLKRCLIEIYKDEAKGVQ